MEGRPISELASSPSGPSTAAREYKDVVASLTAGLDDDAARSAERVAQLRRELVVLRAELDAAADQILVTRAGNEMAWEDALEILWVESWMQMRPYPRPDRLAKGEDAAALVARVEACVARLREQARRRRLRRR